MKQFIRKFVVLFTLIILNGCTFSHQKGSGQNEVSGKIDPGCIGMIDYPMIQEKIMRNCTGCHNPNGQSFDLTGYPQVKARIADVESAVLAGRMPKGNPLSQNLRDLLTAWVDNGALESVDPKTIPPSCTGNTSTGGDSTAVALEATYESIRVNILEPHCNNCHNPAGIEDFIEPSFYDFKTSYELMVSYSSLYKLREGEYKLVRAITPGIGRMPKYAAPLSEEQISVVRQWIVNGLPR